jgi:hypothetical protein
MMNACTITKKEPRKILIPITAGVGKSAAHNKNRISMVNIQTDLDSSCMTLKG